MNSFDKENFRREIRSLVARYGEFCEEDEEILKGAAALLKEAVNYGQPRPCCSCGKLLEPVYEIGDWCSYQPSYGCEIRIIGSYGSRHGMTTFRGIICDDCVSKLNIEAEHY